MSGNVYALLVGIDNYPAPIRSLEGCVNDVNHVETLLRERIIGGQERLKVKKLTNTEATRRAVIEGFRDHLIHADSKDIVLFYYSGHGSQQISPPEFRPLEPDGLDETLVCYDSRTTDWDLADKELAQLVAEVGEKKPHIAIILDCCHSGSGLRGEMDEVGVRRIGTDDRIRPIDQFIVKPTQAKALEPGKTASDWFQLPFSRHVVLAACRAEEEAKETFLGGEKRGAFSYYLLDTLQQSGEKLTYRELFTRVNALVRIKVTGQSPLLESTNTDDLDAHFLEGTVKPQPTYFAATYDKASGWIINGGAVHSIPPTVGQETTYLALFAFDADLDMLEDRTQAVGQAWVTEVLPTASKIEIKLANGQQPTPEQTFKALITALPLAPLLVHFTGEEAGLRLLDKALAHANSGDKPSLFVSKAEQTKAAYGVLAKDDRYRIYRLAGDGSTFIDTPGFGETSAELVVQRLEHIARWTNVAGLKNPNPRIPANAIQMEVFCTNEAGVDKPVEVSSGLHLSYTYKDGKWRAPTFKLKLTNTWDYKLFWMLLDLTETYKVAPDLSPGNKGEWLEPGQSVYALGGKSIVAEVPKRLWEKGLLKITDTLKLIVSTEDGNAADFAQAELPVTVELSKGTRSFSKPLSTLDRLMQRVSTRDLSATSEDEAIVDWTTSEISLTTVRPRESVQLGGKGQPVTLGQNVTIQGHGQLKAKAHLTTVAQASRDLGNLTLPAVLRDHPEIAQPFDFTTSRGGESGLNVLELEEVSDHSVVTKDDPLVVQIDQPLAEQDVLLPLGWDGEFYLLLGKVQRTATGVEVHLDQLPAPTNEGSRDLKGSIKILFQKLVGQRLGWTYQHPLLRVATVTDDGSVAYSTDGDLDLVRDKVAAAKTILLYIHGITGDTRLMTASAQTKWLKLTTPVVGLHDRYDLILSFDYENLQTSIEENARLLKERLIAVGLRPNHGKTLHIVAHSMGGLVSRWFIEREGGGAEKMVQHLIMVGTPNGGSPWPTVQDWATAALGFGLNGLLAGWTAYAAGALAAAIETVDVALDQMRPDSPFLQQLAQSPDPGVPYTVIAGNTQLIPAALAQKEGETQSIVERLWNKVKPKQWFYHTLDLTFFHEANDIAVSVASIRNVPLDRTPRPNIDRPPVACDHSSYFVTVVGLSALAESLST